MRDGRARVCVATDVAARGIDLPNLDLVIHADLPSNPETLLHRSGRTGRAGRKGICALIVPLHRRAVAARVLRSANLEASTRGAPTMAEIEAHNREQILATATAMSAALGGRSALRRRAARPPHPRAARRRLSPPRARRPSGPRGSLRPADRRLHRKVAAPRQALLEAQEGASAAGFGERAPPMQDGALVLHESIGRNHRADPKWLLPMICKAGDLTKRDIGSIKILDEETRFEISADKADAFAAAIARNGGNIENGITIRSADGTPPRQERKPYKAREDGPRKDYKPRDEAPREPYAARDEAPRKEWKPREAAPSRMRRATSKPPARMLREAGSRRWSALQGAVRSGRQAETSVPAREITPRQATPSVRRAGPAEGSSRRRNSKSRPAIPRTRASRSTRTARSTIRRLMPASSHAKNQGILRSAKLTHVHQCSILPVFRGGRPMPYVRVEITDGATHEQKLRSSRKSPRCWSEC